MIATDVHVDQNEHLRPSHNTEKMKKNL